MPLSLRLVAIGVSGVGALVFFRAGMPLPFLLGPMFACLAAALVRVPLGEIPGVGTACRAVLGVAAGAAITPDLVHRLDTMAASIALVPLFILAAGLVGYPYFRRVCGFDAPTAYFSAMPGGLQDMLVFGEDAGGNPRALSLVHATRVLAIVSLMPALLGLIWGLRLDHPPGPSAAVIPLGEAAVMVGSALIGWAGATRIGLFGASVLGPMAVAAAASLSGLLTHRPPAEAILATQFFIGINIGAKYRGVTLGEVRRIVLAAVGYCGLLALLSVAFAEIAHLLTGVSQVDAVLAFAPGGQSEMVLLAIVAGVDIAYVVTHHVARVILVIVGAPLFLKVAQRGKG